MTMQEFFDKTIRLLRVQGEPAAFRDEATNEIKCVYRTNDGKKCAIGIHIPDELYDPNFEGKNVDGFGYNLIKNIGLTFDNSRNFALFLQYIHDTWARSGGKMKTFDFFFKQVAEKFNLTYPPEPQP